MNRIIKFRAWDHENKSMVYTDENQTVWVGGISTSVNLAGLGSQITSKYTAMQFTGRKDKNGVDIYDGDIIEFDEKEWGGNDNIHIVSWDNESSAWSFGGGSAYDMEFRKVIGNIHQNPDLCPS